MSAEKRKNDNKKAEVKSIKLDQIKSLSSIDIDLKNLQKLADKFDKKGLSAYVPLSNKLLTIYDEMKVVASKSQLDVNEFFVRFSYSFSFFESLIFFWSVAFPNIQLCHFFMVKGLICPFK